jgi:hypothetical protein
VNGRRGRRLRKLQNDLQEGRGYSHLKEEDLDRKMWRDCFGRGFGPVVRQTVKRMNYDIIILWNQCRMSGPSLTGASLCGAYLYLSEHYAMGTSRRGGTQLYRHF